MNSKKVWEKASKNMAACEIVPETTHTGGKRNLGCSEQVSLEFHIEGMSRCLEDGG